MDNRTPLVKCPVCKTSHVINGKTANDNGICASTCESCGHFFKFRKVGPYKTDITFTVNGKSYTVGNDLDPSTSLTDFLRLKNVSTGTKIVCRQGGCGACIVVAKMTLNPNHPPVTAALNSCLCPLFMLDGWEVTTTEGIGSTRTGLHTIQKTLADFGGTQCGFCSPGHVMNMYGLMQQYPGLTKQQVEDHFEGNLCRCTGYRPILDAMKSLVPAQTTDIEDLTRKMCRTSGRLCSSTSGGCGGQCSSAPISMGIHMVFGATRWYKAVDYADLLSLMQQSHGQTVRFLGANTGTGYFAAENIENYDIVIDASGVAEFYVNTYDAQTKTFTLGAGITLSDLMDIFEAQAAKTTDHGNFNELKKYLYRVASSPIRNRGTWAGNLMLKNKYPDFPSDIFNIFTVLNATITIGPGDQTLTVSQFFTTNMAGKCIRKVTFQGFDTNDVVACYKVMPRSQNSLALVNGAFRCTLDIMGTVIGQPIISIGGISGTFHRATQTEQYLTGKQLTSQDTITGALNTLNTELVPSSGQLLPSLNYRKTVACSLLYKFFIKACGDSAGVRFRGAKDVLHDIRPLSSGTQTYDSNQMEWPVNEPVKKVEADIQCSGEAKFVDDVPDYPNQLYGAFVTSTQANATIQTINSTEAANMAGVVRILTASDIPSGGKNDIKPALSPESAIEEPMFTSSEVGYYGQSIAFVVAETQEIANRAAKLVQVTYTNVQHPILTLDEAIAAGSLFKKPAADLVVGDPDNALANATHVSTGTCYTGQQFHFHLETLSSNCVPTDNGGLSLVTPTQWADCVQSMVARLTGLPASKVDVSVLRLGGSYGAKVSRNNVPAGACALASYLLNRPVKMRMELQTNMDMVGGRYPTRADYKVGYDDTGKLQVVQVHIYSGQGFLPNEIVIGNAGQFIDNAYYCANWKVEFDACKTNKAMNTATRGPVSTPTVVIIEQVMERVAKDLNVDPTTLRQTNLYKEGQMTPCGRRLDHCNIDACVSAVMETAQADLRNQVIDYFNRDNRWKKKAIAMVPLKFSLSYLFANLSATVNVLSDGTVTVNHGGNEMGQGIDTKVAQVVAYKLGIPVSSVIIKPPNTIIDATNLGTGGSITSEQCCLAAMTACDSINARIEPVKQRMPGKTWEEVIEECFFTNILLNEKYTFNKPLVLPLTPDDEIVYYSYGAVCTEVELDVLTGEYQINRSDIVYDCGESLNPAVDIGQVEGAFVMGLGYNSTEEMRYDTSTGKLLTNDTWGYHVPTNKDIPVDFRVNLLKNAPNPVGVLRSKETVVPHRPVQTIHDAVKKTNISHNYLVTLSTDDMYILALNPTSGEPPLLMGCSVLFALRKCIDLARKEIGQTAYFALDNPATVEKIQTACMVDINQFLLA